MNFSLGPCFLLLLLLLTHSTEAEVQSCKPSGRVRGEKAPAGVCKDEENDCCTAGKVYTTHKCSPPVLGETKGVLTLNSFQSDEASYGPTECDNKCHSDEMMVVAPSTGWFDNGGRCLNNITITGNGHSVNAIAVDECDSTMGCSADYSFEPSCANNVVDASKAVWKALGVPEDQWGKLHITWSDSNYAD